MSPMSPCHRIHVAHVAHVVLAFNIKTLFPSPCRRFTNAVLTDVTESLISAVKRWIYGGGSTSPSLLIAIIRIANGVLAMIKKPILKDMAATLKKIMAETRSNQPET
jgi:hypothetical protein